MPMDCSQIDMCNAGTWTIGCTCQWTAARLTCAMRAPGRPAAHASRPQPDWRVWCRCLDVLLHMAAGRSALLQTAPGQPSLLHQLLACTLSPEAVIQQEAALQPLYDATASSENSTAKGAVLSLFQAEAAALSVLLPCRAALHVQAAAHAAVGAVQAADTSRREPAPAGGDSGVGSLLPGQAPASLLDAACDAAQEAGCRLLRQLEEAGLAATADSLVRRAVC